MKKTVFIVLIFVLLISCLTSLFACSDKNIPASAPNDTKEKIGTGFPAGQMQREYIYYDGAVWVYDSYTPEAQRLDKLPSGANLIGQTLENDPYEMPSENLHTAHVEVGQNVYLAASGDAIYIESSNGVYYRYVRAD